MKLSPLLSQFLSTTKELKLTGIGRFSLDNAGTITFDQDASVKEDPELVRFIAEKTGKMKSLISADLDSHLELARQFLNIGKPYLFEGIGTLSKNKYSIYDFTQVSSSNEKTKDAADEGRDITSTTENSFTDYEEMFSPKKPKALDLKKIAGWVIALAGLSLAVFGGYLVYNRTNNKRPEITTTQKTEPQVITQPKDSVPKAKDSIPQTAPVNKPVNNPNTYRFVIEKATRARALYRYNFLKTNFIDVKMDTKDSVFFKLYFVLPSSPADTAKKRDSLQRLYGTRGRTTIEFN